MKPAHLGLPPFIYLESAMNIDGGKLRKEVVARGFHELHLPMQPIHCFLLFLHSCAFLDEMGECGRYEF